MRHAVVTVYTGDLYSRIYEALGEGPTKGVVTGDLHSRTGGTLACDSDCTS